MRCTVGRCSPVRLARSSRREPVRLCAAISRISVSARSMLWVPERRPASSLVGFLGHEASQVRIVRTRGAIMPLAHRIAEESAAVLSLRRSFPRFVHMPVQITDGRPLNDHRSRPRLRRRALSRSRRAGKTAADRRHDQRLRRAARRARRVSRDLPLGRRRRRRLARAARSRHQHARRRAHRHPPHHRRVRACRCWSTSIPAGAALSTSRAR